VRHKSIFYEDLWRFFLSILQEILMRFLAIGFFIAQLATSWTVISVFNSVEAQLRFSPQRIVITDRQRTARLTLTNPGNKIASYRIEMVDMLYQDDGRVREAKKVPSNYPTARPMLRFSPRQVRLRPGESQTVRLLVRRTRGLADGEYRVHAKLRKLPDVSKIETPTVNDGKLSGTVGINQSVAIAVIVRRGKTHANGYIQSMTLQTKKNAPPILDLRLGRTGNRSLYTDLVLRDAKGKLIQQVKGIALPVPNAWRRYFFRLPNLTRKKIASGNYYLELLDRDAGKLLDKKRVSLKPVVFKK
jgi:P pilus assembly chaperone PapD